MWRPPAQLLKNKTVTLSNNFARDMIGMSKSILLKGLHFVKAINAIIALSLQKSK